MSDDAPAAESAPFALVGFTLSAAVLFCVAGGAGAGVLALVVVDIVSVVLVLLEVLLLHDTEKMLKDNAIMPNVIVFISDFFSS